MRPVILLMLLLSGCGLFESGDIARNNCLEIELGAPLQPLPTDGPARKYSSTSHQVISTGEHTTLSCCQACNWGQLSCACAADCTEPALRADPIALGSPYSGKCGTSYVTTGPTGVATCNVWARNEQVVGVWFVCDE